MDVLNRGWIKTPAGRIRRERPRSSARNHPEQKFYLCSTSVFGEAVNVPLSSARLELGLSDQEKKTWSWVSHRYSRSRSDMVSFSQIYRLVYPFHGISNNNNPFTTLCRWCYEKKQNVSAIIWNCPLKRRDLIWTQSKFNDGNFQYTLRHFLFRTPECFISVEKSILCFLYTPHSHPAESAIFLIQY